MAKVFGPDFVALQVRDLERSRKFYTDVVGLQVGAGSPPHAVVFDTQPIPFAVREPMVDLDSVRELGWGIALWLRCDDADALHVSLKTKGVTVLGDPQSGPFGRTFSFVDPDGYQITVHDKG